MLKQKILTKKVDAPVLAKSDDNDFPSEDSVIFVHSFQIQSLNFKPMTMMTMMKMMLNRIKKMTVNLLLTVIRTDEADQRDIYKCPWIRVAISTRMMMNNMITSKKSIHNLDFVSVSQSYNTTEQVIQLCQYHKTSQELRMLSSVTINCQITKLVMNSGSQLSEL